MLLAAMCQLFAGLAASALAALDDYVTSAIGYVTGSAVGLVFILSLVGDHGIGVMSIGMAFNGAIAFAIPAVALAVRARRERMPPGAARSTGGAHGARLGAMGTGVALPLALQALYVVSNRLAHGKAPGRRRASASPI